MRVEQTGRGHTSTREGRRRVSEVKPLRHRLGGKSRMRHESHVRFRDGVEVQFPRATRLQSGSLEDDFRWSRPATASRYDPLRTTRALSTRIEL